MICKKYKHEDVYPESHCPHCQAEAESAVDRLKAEVHQAAEFRFRERAEKIAIFEELRAEVERLTLQRDNLGGMLRQMLHRIFKHSVSEMYDFLVKNGVSGKVTREENEL